MKSVVVRNLPDEVHVALKARASARGSSVEAELRRIIAAAVLPSERIRLGSALARADINLTDEEHHLFARRDDRPSDPVDLG